MQETIDWAEMELDAGELAYLAEQRALRAFAAQIGINLGATGSQEYDNRIAQGILESSLWREMGPMLTASYMDGMLIGWVGHRLKEGGESGTK